MTFRSFAGGSLHRMEDEEVRALEPGKVMEGQEVEDEEDKASAMPQMEVVGTVPALGPTIPVDSFVMSLEASVGRSGCPTPVRHSSPEASDISTDILCCCRRLSALRDVPTPRASKYLNRAANSGGGP